MDTIGFNRGISKMKTSVNGLGASLSKLAGMVGFAFSLTAIKKFAGEAIELASDIEEVDNVVSKAFGSMRNEMDALAETAVKNLGMSRLTAYQTGSTFMSMGKSMVDSLEDAKNMALTLTKTTANMASFFNVSQDTASTALKSIYTGETETLKQFGIVMTEVNLQQFAYQQGINKTIKSMTQSEKTMLRYKYVMEQLAFIGDDFKDTQDSWANQTRILSEQWKEFMAAIGSGLITVLKPLVKILNEILSEIITLANTLGKVLSNVFGVEAESVSAGTEAVEAGTEAMEDYAEAAEEAYKSVAAFDKLNVVDNENKSDDSAYSSDNISGNVLSGVSFETTEAESSLDSLGLKIQGFLTDIKEWFGSLDFKPLLGSVKLLGKEIGTMAGIAWDGLQWIVTDVFEPLSRWAVETMFPGVVKDLADRINMFATLIETVKPGLKYFWDKFLVPVGEWTGETIMWALETMGKVISDLTELIDEKGDKINDIIEGVADIFSFLWEVISFVLDMAKAGIETFAEYIDDIVGDIIDILDSFVNDFIGNILVGDWEAAWQGLVDTFSNIFSGIKTLATAIINSVIEMLNKISFDVPDWVPVIGGKHFGFNIPKIDDSSILESTGSRLVENVKRQMANGYTAMQNATKPSLIASGSNQLDKLLENTMSQNNGDMTLNVNLDGKQIYSSVMSQNSIRKKAGLPAFE